MFSKKALYQYGSNPKNIVKLSIKAADIMNKARMSDVVETDDGYAYVKFNLTPAETKVYNATAALLNKYIDKKGGSIDCDEGYLDHNDILTRIK